MSKLFISIVEDDIDDQDFIHSALQATHKNLEISTFSSGAQFLTFINTTRKLPDLVVTDLRMPVVSGFEVIKQIKNNDKTNAIPIVVLSTSANESDRKQASNLGAVAYFVKPYTEKEYTAITTEIIQILNQGFQSLGAITNNCVERLVLLQQFLLSWNCR